MLPEHHGAVKTILVVTTLLVAIITSFILSKRRAGTAVAETLRALSYRIGYSRLYRLCGVLLLTIGVVMPVVGFFSISRYVESQLLVKYTQLRAAADLEHRIDHVETLNVLPTSPTAVNEDILCTSLKFLRSGWELVPQPPSCGNRENEQFHAPAKASRCRKMTEQQYS